MKKNIRVYIEDILESIQRIEDYTQLINKDDFVSNCQVQDAVIRRLAIIGEAVRNTPEKIKAKYPELPWRKIAGMRDILIHEYSGVNLERVWNVIKEDLIILKGNITKIKSNLTGEENDR